MGSARYTLNIGGSVQSLCSHSDAYNCCSLHIGLFVNYAD